MLYSFIKDLSGGVYLSKLIFLSLALLSSIFYKISFSYNLISSTNSVLCSLNAAFSHSMMSFNLFFSFSYYIFYYLYSSLFSSFCFLYFSISMFRSSLSYYIVFKKSSLIYFDILLNSCSW